MSALKFELEITPELLFEMLDDLEDAGIDYGAALAQNPDSEYVKRLGENFGNASVKVRNAVKMYMAPSATRLGHRSLTSEKRVRFPRELLK